MAKSYLDKDGLLYFLQKIRPNATPSMDGAASTGTAKRFALQDHVHPSDTSKAPLASPALTGTPTAPTAETGTATTQIATTEFVANTVGAMTSGVADVQIDNTSIVTSGIAKIPSASSSAKGLMSSAHYSKLEGIASGAEVNQNAFSNVKIGSTTIAADSKTDTLTLTAGSNVTLTPNSTNDSVTIAATDTQYSDFNGATSSAAGANGLVPAPASGADKYVLVGNGAWRKVDFVAPESTTSILNATYSLDSTTPIIEFQLKSATSSNGGMMSKTDKAKLDSLTITNGVIDASNLPSYVDDVIEAYARSGQTALSQNWLSTTSGGSALTPETGKIYVLMADSGDYAANTQFRWGGTSYVKLSDGGVSSITNAEIDTIVAS